ncbi:MAG: TRAP transporter small permease subunit [Gammaproteobacteria bacterium]|nr:TRAP transporter small permease subunit [Gammaproteobacteria bacterium]
MSAVLNLLFKIKHGLIIFEKIVAASSLLLLLVLAIIQIIARNFFDMGFSQVDVISRHLILFIIFMGAALVSEQNRHIKIDILTTFLTTDQQEKLIRPLLLLSAIISLIFTWYAGVFWLDEWHYAPANERWSVYLALILPVGFFILSLHLLLLTLTGFEHECVILEPPMNNKPPCSEIL